MCLAVWEWRPFKEENKMIRKTKIVCTLGPASDSEEMISKLMDAGMNVCRLNMSHGSYEEQGARIDRIKRLRAEKNIPVAIMLDTKGRGRRNAGVHHLSEDGRSGACRHARSD